MDSGDAAELEVRQIVLVAKSPNSMDYKSCRCSCSYRITPANITTPEKPSMLFVSQIFVILWCTFCFLQLYVEDLQQLHCCIFGGTFRYVQDLRNDSFNLVSYKFTLGLLEFKGDSPKKLGGKNTSMETFRSLIGAPRRALVRDRY